MQVTEGHIFSQMSFRDAEDTDERLILELDTGPELVNRRGALQGGLVATLIDIAAGRLADRHVATGHDVTTADMTVHFLASIIAVDVTDVARDRLAARATVTFAVLAPR